MSTPLLREQWPFYLDSFSKHNQGRPTELKIFDYIEVENRLPLNGIYLEEAGEDSPRIEILLGGAAGETPHMPPRGNMYHPDHAAHPAALSAPMRSDHPA